MYIKACLSVHFCGSTMAEASDYIFDHDTDEEGRGEENDSEDAFEEEVSEDDYDTEYDPDEETTDGEQSSDEEDAPAVVTFQSKNGTLSWHSSPPERRGRLSAENVIKMTPGPTRYAISRVDDIKSCFELLVMNMTDLEGRRVYKDAWEEVDRRDIQAYVSCPGCCVLTTRTQDLAAVDKPSWHPLARFGKSGWHACHSFTTHQQTSLWMSVLLLSGDGALSSNTCQVSHRSTASKYGPHVMPRQPMPGTCRFTPGNLLAVFRKRTRGSGWSWK